MKFRRKKTGRIRTPTFLQMESTECGAASLGGVLGYFGLYVPFEDLREACGVSRNGANAFNILKAARHYGLVAKAFKKEVHKLQQVVFPAIILWNFNHFVVIEGFGKNHVFLNDPATGPRRVTYEEFDKSYSGVCLTFEPGPTFTPAGRPARILGPLATRLAGFKKALISVLLAGFFLIIPGLAVPGLLRIFIDDVLAQDGSDLFGPLCLGMFVAFGLKGTLAWMQQNALLRLETELSLSMSGNFLWHVLRLPIAFFEQRYLGDISSRISINNTVAQVISRELATNIINTAMAVFFFIGMMFIDIRLAAISLGFAIINLLALQFLERSRVDANSRLLQERSLLVGLTMSGLTMIESYKANGSENDFFVQWAGRQVRALNAQQELGQPTLLLTALPAFLASLNMLAVLLVGGLQVADHAMTLGSLVAFQSLLLSFSGPIGRLVALGSKLHEATGDLMRLDDVLKHPTIAGVADQWSVDIPSAKDGAKLTGQVEFRNMTFGYSRLDPPLITDFNLTIEPGQRVALVGPSGCGKSTIAKLLCGLVDPWDGDILFDNIPRKHLHPARLINSLAMVNQDIFLFEGTIRENLALWDTSAPESALVRAAKDACIHGDISAKYQGYNALVEENGRNLSGGQRQRLEIARALVNDPSILVLDEATNALDPPTELAIDTNLRRRGCTCVLVAHRLSTIRDCDKILVLDKGNVVERGTHNELMRRNGLYSTLVKS
ncbi:NHLP family bacteriocin export ABC transporter peptidase/permease/ATPase subunit [Desulfovibrio inopinatus]|uniref:NHLP family bacteriocin export ABC transporter peptidase/permease/ATPase subunit n=1 Tax=Desulfovibrio inopinatus TaxID=102109 RepID=UPI0004133357|nr:NHLP family bacteriocin export ABC transporter peptidase/permease/ATPase subunit [Desulfovibrio inopinatus]